MNRMENFSWEKHEQEIINCCLCPRLVGWRELMAQKKRRAYFDQIYWGKPVPGFGDRDAQVVIVGLAPGAHGSNRTGRMFTGDASGYFLYSGLYRFGFVNQPVSISQNDGLQLMNAYITAVCRCAPPKNKPEKSEINTCLPFLIKEFEMLEQKKVIVVLGKIAFDVVQKLYSRETKTSSNSRGFKHGAEFVLNDGGLVMLCSYHPSQQNTQTGRLTIEMGDKIWQRAWEIVNMRE